jgi:uncharacterized membrane protein
MVVLYVAVFGHLTWAHHANYGTFGFDMGIYDQGIWLMSRFEDPFVTVRGLPYFGHHVNLITVLFVPAYWLGAGPIFLYLVETVTLAVGAIPLWLLARDRWQNEWAALVPAAAFLMYPSVQWINWWHFHPDALIITPLLFAWWLASRGRWGWFWIAVGIALSAKEDAAMAIFVLGLVVAWRWDRRRGLITAGAGMAWFMLATRVLIPLLTDGQGPFYGEFFADFGSGSTLQLAQEMLTHPGKVGELLTEETRVDYYRQMLAPVGFLPLAAPVVFAIGVPQGLVNSLSSHGPLHEIRYHYSSVVTAAIFLSTVEAVAVVARGQMSRIRFLAGALAATALATNVAWSPSPISVNFDSGVWARHATPRDAAVGAALDLVPDGAGTTATYYLVPHLTHRQHIYEWPNPFRAEYWGVAGEDPHPESNAEYLVLDTSLLGEFDTLYDELTRTDYELIFLRDSIAVARRNPG